MSHTLKYSELYEIFKHALDAHHWANIPQWLANLDGSHCDDVKDPWQLFSPTVFWAMLGAQYFPFRSFELARDKSDESLRFMLGQMQECMSPSYEMHEALEQSMLYLDSFYMRLKAFKREILVGEYEGLMKRHIKFSRFISENVLPQVQVKKEKKKSKLVDGGSVQHEEME